MAPSRNTLSAARRSACMRVLTYGLSVLFVACAMESPSIAREAPGGPKSDAAADLACMPVPSCEGSPPGGTERGRWNRISSRLSARAGRPHHRARDLMLGEGDRAWALAKFAYGATDKDLEGEDVEVWLDSGCTQTWRPLGVVRTTTDPTHATVEGVEDEGGRVFVDLGVLPVGRHHVSFRVKGDLSRAEQIIDVVPRGAKWVVTDIDGTLTESEASVVGEVVTGRASEARQDAAVVLGILASRGYHIAYVTARPDWLVGSTRDWLAEEGFPPGVVHTSDSSLGLFGAPATEYKVEDIRSMATHIGAVPSYGFGNKASDVSTYQQVGIAPANTAYIQLDGDLGGGIGIESYSELVDWAVDQPGACE